MLRVDGRLIRQYLISVDADIGRQMTATCGNQMLDAQIREVADMHAESEWLCAAQVDGSGGFLGLVSWRRCCDAPGNRQCCPHTSTCCAATGIHCEFVCVCVCAKVFEFESAYLRDMFPGVFRQQDTGSRTSARQHWGRGARSALCC